MPCYRPNMMLFNISTNPKTKLKFESSFNITDYEKYDVKNAEFGLNKETYQWIRVPCGQCIGCREAYSKQWAVRCMLEASNYKHNYFVTLTYNDAHLPRDVDIFDKETGEIAECSELGSLDNIDLQKFIKRLRKYFKSHFDFPSSGREYYYEDDVSEQFLLDPEVGIRFFACGEYGTQGDRPHYHIILFNCPLPLDDLKVHSMTRDGNIIWNSGIIEKCWSDEKGSIGFSSVCEVNWDTCAYTARYCLKKANGSRPVSYYFEKGQKPEFTVMSRKPGIGREFFETHFQEIYENDEMIIKGHAEKIQPVKPPKYFDKLYRDIYPEDYDALVEKRKQIVVDNTKTKLHNTTMSEKQMLRVEMESKQEKMKMFKLQRSKF